MSVYMTETEQWEAIKKWWQRHGHRISVALSVILLIVTGYQYWNWHQDKIRQQASNAYEHLMVALSNQDNKAVRGYAKELLNDYNQTVYADAARLTLAKLYVLHEHYAKAEEQLAYVAMHAKMPVLRQVANIRLARVLTAEKSYDKALETLRHTESSLYAPVVKELKGDIYAATGHYKKTVVLYRDAIRLGQGNGMGNMFLEMKTNELAAMIPTTPIQKANA